MADPPRQRRRLLSRRQRASQSSSRLDEEGDTGTANEEAPDDAEVDENGNLSGFVVSSSDGESEESPAADIVTSSDEDNENNNADTKSDDFGSDVVRSDFKPHHSSPSSAGGLTFYPDEEFTRRTKNKSGTYRKWEKSPRGAWKYANRKDLAPHFRSGKTRGLVKEDVASDDEDDDVDMDDFVVADEEVEYEDIGEEERQTKTKKRKRSDPDLHSPIDHSGGSNQTSLLKRSMRSETQSSNVHSDDLDGFVVSDGDVEYESREIARGKRRHEDRRYRGSGMGMSEEASLVAESPKKRVRLRNLNGRSATTSELDEQSDGNALDAEDAEIGNQPAQTGRRRLVPLSQTAGSALSGSSSSPTWRSGGMGPTPPMSAVEVSPHGSDQGGQGGLLRVTSASQESDHALTPPRSAISEAAGRGGARGSRWRERIAREFGHDENENRSDDELQEGTLKPVRLGKRVLEGDTDEDEFAG
ncbi:hypothetical protein M427DRAFT_157487 [Gonapodya prolifera JEL478]|uniref:Uncharacterized protein n=1 Tax=Gonapodya prolifera (strain JEL478) TaxID=1344416 RepID=A0A139A6Z6_GONPJ|nr:hypothetical protein M427DRAFT_157487 [Gonapodya prolifera JEL478]|eukprot:KXS12225.1 hypothetical protein M427DRAFT_157487 [Gonapodya prolifera JEL478]